ncbi:thiamine pyrophosphate-binding protein [Mycolicibacterium septicum]|uniref:thiamine pyrophosphate-binding protein n=1 Tax=Mycolicibacterium septicum TaxID=98668 RepID=UPI001AFC84E7|nr:thiamine pyrophosphate-binding protein [Mycolicibacterium septicum]QRY50204.1 thiamine pyrophosphate-binding protein [Mycolicibacterium septicum]
MDQPWATGHTPPVRVVDFVVDYLAHAGVRHLFGVGGANIEDLYDAAHFHPGVTAVLAKHEFSAATMADGYSRARAGLGVVAATSGGASLNLIPGLGESLASRVPVLAVVGQPPSPQDGLGSFQDTSGRNGSLDAAALFTEVSVYCRRVLSPDDVLVELPRAVEAARTGGPAVLLIPKDVQQSMIAAAPVRQINGHRSPAEPELEVIADALVAVDGPITIIAGEHVARDDARAQLEELRLATGALIATAPDAKDVSAADLGVTGVMGHRGVAEAIAGSALCLLVGTRLPLTARAGLDDALAAVPIFSIGPAVPYLPCRHVHTDELRRSLAQVTRAVRGRSDPRRQQVADRTPAELTPPAFDGAGIRYREAMQLLDETLPDDADVVVDAGNTGASAIHHLPVRQSGRFVAALGMGGMGYSFGAAIGMAFARNNRRTVVIAGDGAFFMHGMEIHTAVQYRLPITFVLFNNNAHAMCVTREQLFYRDRYSYNRFTASRLGRGVASMFPGLAAEDVDAIEHLPQALARALGTDGPSVVSIECSADEIPPFAPFLTLAQSNSITQKDQSHVAART